MSKLSEAYEAAAAKIAEQASLGAGITPKDVQLLAADLRAAAEADAEAEKDVESGPVVESPVAPESKPEEKPNDSSAT